MVIDVTFNVRDAVHRETAANLIGAVGAVGGVAVHKVSNRTFLIHLGGELEVVPKIPLRHRDDLSRAYTSGLARYARPSRRSPRSTPPGSKAEHGRCGQR